MSANFSAAGMDWHPSVKKLLGIKKRIENPATEEIAASQALGFSTAHLLSARDKLDLAYTGYRGVRSEYASLKTGAAEDRTNPEDGTTIEGHAPDPVTFQMLEVLQNKREGLLAQHYAELFVEMQDRFPDHPDGVFLPGGERIGDSYHEAALEMLNRAEESLLASSKGHVKVTGRPFYQAEWDLAAVYCLRAKMGIDKEASIEAAVHHLNRFFLEAEPTDGAYHWALRNLDGHARPTDDTDVAILMENGWAPGLLDILTEAAREKDPGFPKWPPPEPWTAPK